MYKAILMSIRPQHLVNILNGKKTIELRKRFPKDFRGWVYCYCTKGKDILCRYYDGHWFTTKDRNNNWKRYLNGKVVCRFWVDNVDTIIRSGMGYHVEGQDIAYTNRLANRSGLMFDDLQERFGDNNFKAILISKLEIFDKPKELSEFYYYKKRLIDCGRDCPPYVDEVKTQVRKAPQSWQYVYVEDEV